MKLMSVFLIAEGSVIVEGTKCERGVTFVPDPPA